MRSNEADLSGFGCNLSEWTHLSLTCVNKVMNFYVNGIKVYALTFPNDPTSIVGVQYRFNGVGAVKNTFFTY